MVIRTTVIFLGICLSTHSTAGDLLPLNDGRYVTDARLCDMSIDDMYHVYGDGVGIWTRILEGTTLYSYEWGCETQQIDRMGDYVSFNAVCAGEGDEWKESWTFKIPNKNNFIEDGGRGRSFLRCTSKLTADQNLPTSSELLDSWRATNMACQSSTDTGISVSACAKKEVYEEQLNQRGWCYTQDHWRGEDNIWHVCTAELGR
jgi:hypothetical protein